MIKFLGKNWFVIFVVIALLFVFGQINSCERNADRAKLEELQGQLDVSESEYKVISAEKDELAKQLLNRPVIEIPIKVEPVTVYETIDKLQYVARKDYDKLKINRDQFAETCLKQQEEIIDFKATIRKYLKLDVISVERHNEIVANLKSQIVISKRIQSPWGVGFHATWGYVPQFNEFTYTLGFGIHYEINILKIIKAIF